MTNYKPSAYWEQHLSRRQGLLGTGHRQFSLEYNIKMYEAAAANLKAALSRSQTPIHGCSVLDVGCGYGYYVDRFLGWGACAVTGVDLTKVAVQHLQQAFPDQRFLQADISEAGWTIHESFDLVTAISMIFHIVEAERFRNALVNLCQQVNPTGRLLIVDAFRPLSLPTAAHARLRDLTAYTQILAQEGFEIVGLYPMHRWMGQSLIPVLGPALLSQKPFLDFLYRREKQLGVSARRQMGWLNILVAQRM